MRHSIYVVIAPLILLLLGACITGDRGAQRENGVNLKKVAPDLFQANETTEEFVDALLSNNAEQISALKFMKYGHYHDTIFDTYEGFSEDLFPLIRIPWPVTEERLRQLSGQTWDMAEAGQHIGGGYFLSPYSAFPYPVENIFQKVHYMETIITLVNENESSLFHIWILLRLNDDDEWRIHSWQRIDREFGYMVPLTIDTLPIE